MVLGSHASWIRMLRISLAASAPLVGAVPVAFADTLRSTLDPTRGHRIDPAKLLVIEGACYAAAVGLLLLAAFLPRLLIALDALAARAERSRASRELARRTRANASERALIAMFVALVVLLPLQLILDRETALRLAAEDNVIETWTAILYLMAAIANMVYASRFARVSSTRAALWGLGGLYFVVGMEEMSWGQRVLGFATPAALEGLNVQGEITLHNLWSTSINQALGLGVTFVLLVLLPLAHRFWPTGRRLLEGVGFPVAPTRTVVLYLAAVFAAAVIGIRLGTLGIGPRSLYGLQPHFDDEYLEFFLAFLFFFAATSGYRLRLRREPRSEG